MLAEVTSQNPNRDRVTKMMRYARSKVEWYWIVDQRYLTIDVYRLDGETYRHAGTARPGTKTHLPGPVPLVIDPEILA